MSIKKDLQPAYIAVCNAVDKTVLNGQLANFPELLSVQAVKTNASTYVSMFSMMTD